MTSPDKVRRIKDVLNDIEKVCENCKYYGEPDSWGTKAHATAYMAALLGLTVDEMRRKDV